MLALELIAAVLLTSTLSGVFGMVGGMILLWILLLLMPVEVAIAVQGILQFVANGSRAFFSRRSIDWKIIGFASAGLAASLVVLALVSYTPNLILVSIGIGLLPIFCYIPRHWIRLDAGRPLHAVICGFFGGGLNVGVGVAGPFIDIFFARTAMDRHTIIGTKAMLVLLSHAAKVAFYVTALTRLEGGEIMAIALAMPFAIVGSKLGHAILQRISHQTFARGTVFLISAVGLYYLGQGVYLWMQSS